MFRPGDHFTDHGLDDTNVAVQQTAEGTTQKGDPDVGSEADNDHADHGADAANEEDRLATDAIGETAPVHAHHGLREGEGRDEQAGIERRIFALADMESLHECPSIGKDGRESDGLSKPNNGCVSVSPGLEA